MINFKEPKEYSQRKKQRIITFFIGGFIAFLIILQVGLSNRLSTSGEEVYKLQLQTISLEKENQMLHNEIAQKQSLSTIEKQAFLMGYIKATQQISIAARIPVALKP